jgi:hypothetical protein
LDRHLGGICPPFCLGSFRGEGSCSLVGGVWSWRASLPSFASVDLVGARPLSAKQPLEESCLHRPALALLGGVASRLLAQPALRAEPVFLTWRRGDSLACPKSHSHDKLIIHHFSNKRAYKIQDLFSMFRTLRPEEVSIEITYPGSHFIVC